MDPRTPVLVGVAQLNDRSRAAEPIEFMTRAIEAALADAGASTVRRRLQSIRVVAGIWPYKDPGRVVADRLGLESVTTTMTPIGGNEVYDLLATTANDIASGDLDAAVIVAAETLRTRRADRAAGRNSEFVVERPDAAPDRTYGIVGAEMLTDSQRAAGLASAVSFYAMAETALRHRRGERPADHLARIAALWATGSAVAAENPSAWFRDARTPEQIATVGPRNRMVSSPYPKLMTSNIDVDQSAAVVVCSAEVADAAGIPRDRWVFPWSGSGAADHWDLANRWELDASPAMRLSITKTLELAGMTVDQIDLVDLYSCFPVAVQVAQREVGIDPSRPFTITGGLTFFGGPLNSYCLHALARSVELLRSGDAEQTALLTGNGGFFTKHSAAVLGSMPPPTGYRSERVQSQVDALPARPVPTEPPSAGTIEAYTVGYSTDGQPERATVAVLDAAGCRTFAATGDRDAIAALLDADLVGRAAELDHADGVPQVRLG